MHLFLVFVENIEFTVPDQEPGIIKDRGDWNKHANDPRGIIMSNVPLTWKI